MSNAFNIGRVLGAFDPSLIMQSHQQLPEHPDQASYGASLGRAFENGDRFFNTTIQRVETYSGGQFVLLAGLPPHLKQ